MASYSAQRSEMKQNEVTVTHHTVISCDWHALTSQLMSQWHDLTQEELERTCHNRRAIAKLIERKEGIAAPLVENYLRNLERTLPLFE
jgi:hypothetical protein